MDERPPIMPFAERLAEGGWRELRAARVDTLQVNLGRLCNQTCRHCHVEAGPGRTEIMPRETMEQVLEAVRRCGIGTVDLTGGAPEMVPHFEWLVEGLARGGVQLIVRHNFTVQLVPGREHLPELFRDHQVRVVGSLPHYAAGRTEAQRGRSVFNGSIEGMRRLNALGYGLEGSGLVLDLITNPTGAFLPPPQASLEREFHEKLLERHGVRFNKLLTLVNMPIARFRRWLERTGNLEPYVRKLAEAYNPSTVEKVMCRNLVSVGWDGTLYDCDFNQMLGITLRNGKPGPVHVSELDLAWAGRRLIRTGNHCYGCTAGAGSSCGGALTD